MRIGQSRQTMMNTQATMVMVTDIRMAMIKASSPMIAKLNQQREANCLATPTNRDQPILNNLLMKMQ
jgi:hypothetical protein